MFRTCIKATKKEEPVRATTVSDKWKSGSEGEKVTRQYAVPVSRHSAIALKTKIVKMPLAIFAPCFGSETKALRK